MILFQIFYVQLKKMNSGKNDVFSNNKRQRLVDEGREVIRQSTSAQIGVDQIPFVGGLIGRGLTYFAPG